MPNITQLVSMAEPALKFTLTPKVITLTDRVLRGTQFHTQENQQRKKEKYIRKDETLGSQRESLMKR